MTTILMLENYQDQLDYHQHYSAGLYLRPDLGRQTNASTADIWKDETHTLRNLLYAMLLPSANDAAYIVADYMSGGSIDNFVAMMNDEAARIGCTGTTFTDPCGLDPNNVTTARDAYLMVRVAMPMMPFATVGGTPSYEMGTNPPLHYSRPYIIQTTDKLVSTSSYYRYYTKGGKTGSLGEWQNFAGWHTQDGESYISVVLNVPYDADPEGTRPALAETAERWTGRSPPLPSPRRWIPPSPSPRCRVVFDSQTDTVMLYPADNMMTLLPAAGRRSADRTDVQCAGAARRAHQAGRRGGHRYPDHAGRDHRHRRPDCRAAMSPAIRFCTRISRGEPFFSSTYFKVVIVLCIIAAVVDAVLTLCCVRPCGA